MVFLKNAGRGMLSAKVATTIKIDPNQSMGFIITLKNSTEPIVAVIGSKASIRLKVVALMYLRELVANWKGMRVPMTTTAATDHHKFGFDGTEGCIG